MNHFRVIHMRDCDYSEARKSIYVLFIVLLLITVFYLLATLFISMGYESYRASVQASEAAAEPKQVFVIDAGHGGEDPGAYAGDLYEKDVNLKVALMLAQYLNANGFETALTRTEDKMLYGDGNENRKKYYDLLNRVLNAESYGNAVFISIHMNKFPAESCRGIQTFYSGNNPLSKTLAESLQQSAAVLQPWNKRKIKDPDDTIFLLERLKMPAVLVECGFLSNPEEAKLLSDDEYLKKLALTVYLGITGYTAGEGNA
ncbi:MAG: N-acetylmuramoyl-L-alanine amidase [Clostridia bacterium]|nr:N-acetylmuramoyl-L-alanine amidase [Clostridia bacterium]